jgi:hypothetical protein
MCDANAVCRQWARGDGTDGGALLPAVLAQDGKQHICPSQQGNTLLPHNPTVASPIAVPPSA